MKKNSLSLDKELVTTARVDGGLVPDLWFLPLLLWRKGAGDIIPLSASGDYGDPDAPTNGPKETE